MYKGLSEKENRTEDEEFLFKNFLVYAIEVDAFVFASINLDSGDDKEYKTQFALPEE